MVAPATTTLDHFHHELTLARREALAILRRAMHAGDSRTHTPPTKDQLRAAIAILRLPKHVCGDPPSQAGDERPPEPPLPSSPPPAANPRVSPPPSSPRLNDTPAQNSPSNGSPRTPSASPDAHCAPPPTPPIPIPKSCDTAVARLLACVGAASNRAPPGRSQ